MVESQNQKARTWLQWAWLLLAALALLGVARFTRYKMLGDLLVWDRWRHRVCRVGPRPVCWDQNGQRLEPWHNRGTWVDSVPIIKP